MLRIFFAFYPKKLYICNSFGANYCYYIIKILKINSFNSGRDFVFVVYTLYGCQ